jgi:hypothetical protein
MARWRSPGHAYTARILIGRIGGIEEDRLAKLANAGDAAAIIQSVQLKR